MGIKEYEFWEMTIGEIQREAEGIIFRRKVELQDKAVFDYTLAGLIGRATVGALSKNNQFPDIEEAYPSIFTDKEKEKPRDTTQESMARFLQFASNFNMRNKGEDK